MEIDWFGSREGLDDDDMVEALCSMQSGLCVWPMRLASAVWSMQSGRRVEQAHFHGTEPYGYHGSDASRGYHSKDILVVHSTRQRTDETKTVSGMKARGFIPGLMQRD